MRQSREMGVIESRVKPADGFVFAFQNSFDQPQRNPGADILVYTGNRGRVFRTRGLNLGVIESLTERF